MNWSANEFECVTLVFISCNYALHMFQTLSSYSREWLALFFFLAFLLKIVLIGLGFFFIFGFVSVNVILKLIVRENLWPLQMFVFFNNSSLPV